MTRLFTSAKSSQRNRGSTPSTRRLESAPYLTIGQTHLATNIASMQHSAGNRAVHGLLHGNAPPLGQTATGTGLPMMESGDAYEREADRIADQVMGMRSPAHASPAGLSPNTGQPGGAQPGQGLRAGQPLAEPLRRFFEPRFGHSFANVRIHHNAAACESASDLHARAYTYGNNIVFNRSEFQPHDRDGKRLLAHELAHVVQQSRAPGQMRTASLAASMSRVPTPHAQRKLIATGKTADFARIVNAILGVQHEIRIDAKGVVCIHATDVQGPPTRDAKELLSTIRTIINDAKTTTVDFIRGATSTRARDKEVIVGNYELERVDLDDVEMFGMESSHSRMGDNAAMQIIHELTEQYRKQVHGEAFPKAHKAGYAAQERLLGAKLVKETPMTPIGGDEGEVTTTYRYPDGREVDVIARMNFATGQIVSVKRVVR